MLKQKFFTEAQFLYVSFKHFLFNTAAMHHNRALLRLLVKAYNSSILDFYYFPDVIFVGRQRIERQEFLYLLTEEYITLYKHDSFGRYYTLSKKAEDLLYASIILKAPHRRKKEMTAEQQGRLCFA
jgi:hypothetical protein